jgi:hypothetical protein
MAALKYLKHTLILLCIFLAGCIAQTPPVEDGIMALGISSSGKYVIGSTLRKKLILFNTTKQTEEVLSKQANIYSANYVKNNDAFIWQDDKSNVVNVETPTLKVIKIFHPGFASYGEILGSDLSTFIASSVDFNLFINTPQYTGTVNLYSSGFFGAGKLLNLSLSNDNNYLLTCGLGMYDGEKKVLNKTEMYKNRFQLDDLVLWNLRKRTAELGFPGNVYKSYATLSPDSNYIVTGDENMNLNVWNRTSRKFIYEGYDIRSGVFTSKRDKLGNYITDTSVLKAKEPKDFVQPVTGSRMDATISIKFIDKTHYLRFIDNIPYAILYSLSSPSPLKYLKLNTAPYPAINSYERDQAIDSSWKTHMLVIAHAIDAGITVYKYFPKTEKLKVIWNTKTLKLVK